MTIRGVPYENRGPFLGQPTNNNPWEVVSQPPAGAFRADFGAPAPPMPPRHDTGGPGSYDGGYNNEPPEDKKHRLALIAGVVGVSAVLIGGGAFVANTFSGDKDQDDKSTSQEGGLPVGNAQSNEVISGIECTDRSDIYQEGLLNLTDGKDNIVADKLTNLEANVFLWDGVSGQNGPKINEIPSDILAQIRASIDQQIERGEAPSLVNLYGEPSSDANDYDGEINDGLKACTA